MRTERTTLRRPCRRAAPRWLPALLLALPVLLLGPGCASTSCPDEGRSLAIAYVGDLRGTTFGSGRMTLASNAQVDTVAELSSSGDPGLKYTTPEVMCALYERLAELGLEGGLQPGELVRGPGFEVRSVEGVSHFVLSGANAKKMLADFFALYNRTLSLRAVDRQDALDAFESTQDAATGGGR